MAEGNGGDRISLSRETLRAELSQLELRIVDRLTAALDKKADRAEIEALEARVSGLEISRAEHSHQSADLSAMNTRISRLERFRYGVPSAAVLSLIATLILVFAGHKFP